MNPQPRFGVVGCRGCSQLWVVEGLRSADTTECPRCKKAYWTKKLRVLETAHTYEDACEVRDQHLANRNGVFEKYQKHGHFSEHYDWRERHADDPFSDYNWRENYELGSDTLELYRVLVEEKLADSTENTDESHHIRERGELTLTRQAPVSADSTVTLGEDSPTKVWTNLVETEAFHDSLVHAILQTAGGHTYLEYYNVLDDADVDALHGSYRNICLRVARKEYRGLRDLFEQTERLAKHASWTDDVLQSAPRLFALAEDVTPTITFVVSKAFREERDREQREKICQLLSALSEGCDVRVVGSGIELRWLASEHRRDLPSVSEQWRTPLTDTLDQCVEQAMDTYDRDDSEVQVLRWLADAESQELPRSALLSQLPVGRTRLSQYLNGAGANEEGLADIGLVEKHGPRDKFVRLLPAGRQYLDWLDEEIARQRSLESFVNPGCNRSTHNRIPRGSTRRGEEGTVAATENADSPQRFHQLSRLASWNLVAASASAAENGVGVVDYPIQKQENPRNFRARYDATTDELVVGAESTHSHSALKTWVCLARALVSSEAWSALDEGDRIDTTAKFDAFLADHKQILRGSFGMGFLPDTVGSGAGFKDELKDAEQKLCKLTRMYRHEEFEGDDRDARSEIAKFAKGLATTMKDVLELAGVDVTVEFRVVGYNSSFEEKDRAALVETITNAVAVWSKYGNSNAYKQLYESDPENRAWAIDASVDYADPYGELSGSIAVVGAFGSKLDSFKERLVTALEEPHDLHEDAPELAISVPVRTSDEFDRGVFVETVERMCQKRNLRPSREAVSLYRLVTAAPYDVAAALNRLGREDERREIRLSEIRYTLAGTDESRVFLWVSGKLPNIVSVLLAAEEPLSETELMDCAGVDDTRTLDKHVERLTALSIIYETDEGLRLTLPFHTDEERYADKIRPWFVKGSDDSELPFCILMRSIGADLVVRTSSGDDRRADMQALLTGPPDPSEIAAKWPWLEKWMPVLRTVTTRPEPENTGASESVESVVFGNTPSQTSIQEEMI